MEVGDAVSVGSCQEGRQRNDVLRIVVADSPQIVKLISGEIVLRKKLKCANFTKIKCKNSSRLNLSPYICHNEISR